MVEEVVVAPVDATKPDLSADWDFPDFVKRIFVTADLLFLELEAAILSAGFSPFVQAAASKATVEADNSDSFFIF